MAAMASLMNVSGKNTKWPVRGAEIIVCQAECSPALSLYVLLYLTKVRNAQLHGRDGLVATESLAQ